MAKTSALFRPTPLVARRSATSASCRSSPTQGKRVASPGGRQVNRPTWLQPRSAARSISCTADSSRAVRWCRDSGAASAMTSDLGLGDVQNQLAVQLGGELDLAAQPAGLAALGGHGVEQIVLQRLHRRQQFNTGFIYIDVAGGTGTGSTALGENSGHAVLHRAAHGAGARQDIHFPAGAVSLNKGNHWHNCCSYG